MYQEKLFLLAMSDHSLLDVITGHMCESMLLFTHIIVPCFPDLYSEPEENLLSNAKKKQKTKKLNMLKISETAKSY